MWLVSLPITKEEQEQWPELHPVVLQLLKNRGLNTQEQVDEFLQPDYSKDIHDPYLFQDMQKAVERVYRAIAKQEKIVIHGDYDADGVCSTAVLVTILRQLGAKNISVYIPNRLTEGYGLNMNTVDELISRGENLVITCDCAISNVEEIKTLQAKNVDVILTDHHQAQAELPPAFAIINPTVKNDKYPFELLAGSGVAWKLAQGLLRSEQCPFNEKEREGMEKWLLDLVAISTITDMVPLIGENRTIVKYGLIVLKKTKRLGLKSLCDISNSKVDEIDTQVIGWRLGPRLNAAGRVDHANGAYELLMADNEAEAKTLAQSLQDNNTDRQKQTDQMLSEAMAQIGEVNNDQKVLVAFGEDWSTGLIGLVAGRLMDRFHRPAFAMGKVEGKIVGSCRSIDGFDIAENLEAGKKFLTRFGGHKKAGGFTLDPENYDAWVKWLKKTADKKLTDADLENKEAIEMIVNLKDVNWELWDQLEKFEPFGEGNLEPTLAVKGVKLVDKQFVGADGKHVRLFISEEGNPKLYKVMAFSSAERLADFRSGDIVDVAFTVNINQWNGNREIQLKLVDIIKNSLS